MTDQINPSHYQQYPIEAVDIISLVLDACEITCTEAWLLGNELKYRLRAGFKDPSKIQEDIDKALWYNKYRMLVRDGLELVPEVDPDWENISEDQVLDWNTAKRCILTKHLQEPAPLTEDEWQ